MRSQNPGHLRLRLVVQGLAFLCILLVTNAESTCKRGCPESDDGYLSYTQGNVYDYNFDSILSVGITRGSGNSDDTSLKITGNAKLFAEGNCGYTLQLGAVKVTATKENVEKKIMQSIQKPVHFTMVGGNIEPELCVDQEDNIYALNIKRAVISMLQSKPDTAHEIDIFGQCPTHTTVTKIGSAEIVNKVRNLNTCNYRRIINSGILTNALQTKPGKDSTSVLKADYAKESKVEKGLVNNVQLVEEYKYVDLAQSQVGMRAKVVTNLKLRNLVGTPAAAPTPATGERSVSIMFQQPDIYTLKNIAALKNSLTELVQQLDGYVKKDSAKGFVELIRLMRNSDTETLLELGAFSLPNKVLARKVYLDALFRTATSESARAILKQFSKFNEKEKAISVMSLNLVQTVDKDTLNQASTLLNPNAIKEIYLAVGNLVSKYCERNGCKIGEVDGISKKFTESLKHCKANTKKDEERVLYVLKGIRNTRHLASSIAPALAECVKQGRSNRVRVAALQAFSAANCDANLQKKAMELLADRNEDSELRIEAFLAVIECPSGELANEIAEIVNTETVHQVGGFITSSIRALRDSTDADKELQRRHLGNIRVTKIFPKDFRRYSYNNEVSYKMEALGLSASADYKLIYSQNGFLPRSARLNIKAEDYGINMNILEASIRQDNLENVIEYFLGPKGLVNKDLSEILGKVDVEVERHRTRRSIADDSSKVAKKYKSYGTKMMNDLNLDLSLKLFGSEILFLSLGDDIPSTFDEIAKEFTEAFEKVKIELTNYNKQFSSHNFFMDTEIVYPTGVGVPMELVSDGFMANKLDLGISVDVESLMQSNWYNSKYKLKLVPSIDANVNLKFGFNALVLSTGLRSIFTMHTATGNSMDLSITHEGAGFDLNVELPREKIELIDFKMQNDFYFAEQDKPVKSIPLKSNKADINVPTIESCYNQFESLGFTPCVLASSFDINMETTLSDSFDFSVYIMTERHFNFRGYYNDQKENILQWNLDYSTPGSKESHDTSLTVELGSKPRYYGRASLENIRYHLAIEAGLNNDDKELVWYAQYEQNKDIKKSKLGFLKNGNEYRPIIEIQDTNGRVTNEINGYRVDGRVLIQKSGEQSRLNFENLQVANKKNNRAILNGYADLGPSSISTELQLTSNEDTVFIKSNLKVAGGEFAAGLFVNDVKQSEYVYGTSVYVHMAEQLVNAEVLSKFGNWEASSTNEVRFVKQEGTNSIASSKFTSSISVTHKQNNVGSLQVQGLTEGQSKIEVNINASSSKKAAGVAVKYVTNQKAQNDYQFSINAKLNKHFVDILSKRDIVNNRFVLDNALTTSWGSAFTLKGELGPRYTQQDIYMDLQGTAQANGKDKPTQWILKVNGSPEKTITEFKVTRENADVIKLIADTIHPQDKVISGKVNVIVKNVVTAKADFKLAKNGKGEVTAVIETIKIDPNHKIELISKFQVQHPKYDVEANVALDGLQKLYIKTENTVDNPKFNTKNEIAVAEKKVSFAASGLGKGDWRMNGEVQGSFTFICPQGRTISGSLQRKLITNAKTGISQGHMDIHLVDQLPNGGNKRSLALSGKIDKFNIKSKEFSATSKMTYTNFQSNTLDVDWHLKKLPKDQNKMIDFGTTVKGPLTKYPIDVTFVVDEYSERHIIFNIGAIYGDLMNAKINGNYDLSERGSAMKYEVHSNVNLPQTSFKSIEFTTKGQFMESQTEGGNYIFELFVEEKVGNDQFVKLNANVKTSEKISIFAFNLHTHKMPSPLEIDGSYLSDYKGSLKEDNTSGSVKYEFNFKCGEQFLKSSNDLSFSGKTTIHNRLTVSSSFEGATLVELEVKGKLLDTDSYKLIVVGKQDEQSYHLDTVLYRGIHKKGLEVSASLPNVQPISVVTIFEVMGRSKAKMTAEIYNVLNLDFKFNGEASYNAIDDFYVVAQWNSAKLTLENYDLDLRTQGKSLSMLLKNVHGEIFSGSATCAIKKENNKKILEGQGQIKFKGATQNTNFRLTRQVYEMGTDKEIGFSYNFNGNFGPKNGVSTFKITNKDFNIKLSVCEEKKQCTNVQILVSNDLTKEEASINYLLILLDLREIGFPYEFELQSKNIREGLKYQFMLDSTINSNNNLKHNLLANIQPSNAKVQLKLPSREILLEASQKYPASGQIFGHYEHSITFFIDKTKKPNDVVRFVAQADLTGIESVAVNAKGLLKLEHPTIRSLSINGKLDANRDQNTLSTEVVFDIFNLPEQQVIASSQLRNMGSNNGFNVTSSQVLRSSGLGFEYTLNSQVGLNTAQYEFSSGSDLSLGSDLKASVFVFGNKEHAEVLVHSLNEEVVKLAADYIKQKKTTKFNAKLPALGRKPVEINAEIQPNSAKLNVVRNGLLNAHGEVKLGKEFKFEAESAGKELINGRVGLDASNFLRSTYSTNEENVKEFMNALENELKVESAPEVNKGFEKLKQIIDRQVELFKNSAPDFSQLKNSYQNNINEIVKELELDPAMKQISEAIQNLYTRVSNLAAELTKLWGETYKQLHNSFVFIYGKYQVILKETLIPAWEEFVSSTRRIVLELRLEIFNLYSRTFRSVLDVFKQYEPALRNYGKAIAETLKPLHEVVQELYKSLATAVEDLVNEWVEYWTNLPSFEAIQNELKEILPKLHLAEKLLELVNNVFDQLHVLPLTAETGNFLEKIREYFVAKLKQVQVDDEKFIEEVIQLFIKAVRSVLASIELATPGASATGFSLKELFSKSPVPNDLFEQLSALLTFRISVINFLLNEDLENWFTKDFISSWVFFNDFNLKGHIADGRHIFTFDGQHIYFTGNCKYILAQDSVDNNFTVIAQVNSGKIKSIFLTDREGQFMEINDGGFLKLNGNAVEFPQHENGMHSWRLYYTVYMVSEHGVYVMCTIDLKVCHININGFYTSKIRGLLGNGNAEPYDDFIQIDGSIANDAATFVNGYGLGKCNPATVDIQTEDANMQRAEICTELFAYDSPLAVGYLFIDSKPYRLACDQNVLGAAEKDKEQSACSIATAYASVLKLEDVFVFLPKVCLKCSGQAGQRELGDEFTLKVPNNKADVIFVVDFDSTPAVMQNLVTPVVTEVRETLKSRGFTDVQIGVIAYSADQCYPAILTSDNGKLNYQGNLGDIKLNGPKSTFESNISQMITEKKVLDILNILESLVKSIIPQSDELAFRTALNYPFRAGAAKSIVAVRSNNLEYDNVLKFVRAHLIGAVTQFDAALLHVFAPVKGLSLEGVSTEKIIGFNSRLVATLDGKDAKKRAKLQFQNDMGIDFVLNNGGWVFDTQNIEQMKPQELKKAVNQITASLADTLFKTEIVTECRCMPIHGIHAQHKCVIKSTNFVPNKKIKT